MKAVLICPSDRPAVARLADHCPLAAAPLLGRCVLEYWIESLAARGATDITVLAADRPLQIRNVTEAGARWGVRVDVVPESRELSVEEARVKYRRGAADWIAGDDVVLMEYLPGQPELPLFDSYAAWYAAAQAFMPRAITPGRIGAREIKPGVWLGLYAQVSSKAELHAPCWIGSNAVVAPGTVIGPNAILEDCVIVERGAIVRNSIVCPGTFVGEMISVDQSLASGSLLVNWQNGSCLEVPDAFFLSSLDARYFAPATSSWTARLLALAAMAVTSPFALAWMALSIIRGESPLQLRLGVRPQPRAQRSAALQTFAYYELNRARTWLRRWPQFWSVVRGDLSWFGNRPLRPTQVLALSNDFERLWLTAPIGLVSLADAYGCTDEPSHEVCAHASFYAVNASRRLNWFIFTRTLVQAAMMWPLRWKRRKDAAVTIPQLVPKSEG